METTRLETLVSRINANEPLPNQRRTCETESPVMMRLWLRMNEMYGNLWESAQGQEPNETWAMGLSTLSPEQIGAGLVALRDSAKPFPPTLPEFMGLCRGPASAPFQHLQSRSCYEALNAPIIDKGEGALELPDPNHKVPPLFDFKALWDST